MNGYQVLLLTLSQGLEKFRRRVLVTFQRYLDGTNAPDDVGVMSVSIQWTTACLLLTASLKDEACDAEEMKKEAELIRQGFRQLGITTEPTNTNIAKIRAVASRFILESLREPVDYFRMTYKLYRTKTSDRRNRMALCMRHLQDRYDETGNFDDVVEFTSLRQRFIADTPIGLSEVADSGTASESFVLQIRASGSTGFTPNPSVHTMPLEPDFPSAFMALMSAVRLSLQTSRGR